jgi:hypothetical protein
VRDTTPPALTVPTDIVEEAKGAGGNIVDYQASATDAVDDNVDIVCVPPSGSLFGIEKTTVACTATDDANNQAQALFHVTVQDTTPPEVTVSGDKKVEATGPDGAAATFTASALDIVDGPVSPVCIIGPDHTCIRAMCSRSARTW